MRTTIASVVLLGLIASQPALAEAPTPTTPRVTAAQEGQRPDWRGRLLRRFGQRRNAAGRLVRRLFHRPKVVTAAAAAQTIKPGDRVFVPVGHGAAHAVLDEIATEAGKEQSRYTSKNPVRVVGLTNTAGYRLFPRNKRVRPISLFVGPNTRDAVAGGRGSFIPIYLSQIPSAFRSGTIPVDKALVKLSPPDRLGYCTLGAAIATAPAAIWAAKEVIGVINPNVPRTNGAARIHISMLDKLVKSDKPLRPVPAAPTGEAERKIAKHVVSLLPRRPTMQFGIGAIPDAVAAEIAAQGRAVRVHSEMISEGVNKLVEQGAVKGKVKYSFAVGSQELLTWMNGNSKLKACSTEYVNDPQRIGRIKRFCAVNGAAQVDLFGAVNAQMINEDWYSGVGGQVDFMRGAMRSQGGRAIIAMRATARVPDGRGGKKEVSRIVMPTDKEPVTTTSMHDLQYVVTEHGVARLYGKSVDRRAEALISVAAPQFRDGLKRELQQWRARSQQRERARLEASR